jgi:c-di-GMP-binding flagellar brake protein YcgR
LLHEVEVKDKHIKDMEMHIKNYDQQFVDQEKEIEAIVFERGLEIIHRSMEKFTEYLDRVILKANEEHHRLKNEIQRQEELRVQIELDIKLEETRNVALRESLAKQVDPRRNVLKVKEFMTCTPDMDIILPHLKVRS